MLTHIHPKLPMRNRAETLAFYTELLRFSDSSAHPYPDYLLVQKDNIEIHFFLYPELDIRTNDGQVYIRVQHIEQVYQQFKKDGVVIHPQGELAEKPWGQKEFAILDPSYNLLTFGESSQK